MRTRKQISGVLAVVVFVAALSLNAGAQTNLIDEDFQSPVLPNNTANPSFTGWSWDGGNSVKARNTVGTSDVPGDHPTVTNQVIQLEWTSAEANYDVAHGWSSNDIYVLSINASPQSWHGADDRYLDPSLRQQDGTVLWSDSLLMPTYDNFGRNPWTPAQAFQFVIYASNFTAGTEGELLSLKIDHSAQRGIYVDNVSLTEGVLPEDTTPPTPDPMTWEVEPNVVDFTNISMTCSVAVDDSPYGVEYYFENTNTGVNSGWQTGVEGNTWTESGLAPSTTNSYRARARDLSPNTNTTDWTTVVTVVTPPPDLIPPTPDPMTWAVEPMVADSLNIYMEATTATDPYLGVEYYFENTNTGANSGWQASPVWSETCLETGTPYTYRVKARDLAPGQNETAWSSNVTVVIPAPSAPGLLVDTGFQVPLHPNNTVNPFFVGWTVNGKSQRSDVRTDGIPGDPGLPNQVVHFEQTSHSVVYDICHEWAANEIYVLTLNASPQAWNGDQDRYIAPNLLQQDNTVLWATNSLMPKYTNSFFRAEWTESQTFTYEIHASEFATETEGEPIRLKIGQAGQRGIYVDNVSLSAREAPIPGLNLIVR